MAKTVKMIVRTDLPKEVEELILARFDLSNGSLLSTMWFEGDLAQKFEEWLTSNNIEWEDDLYIHWVW